MMPVTIKQGNYFATIKGGVWSSDIACLPQVFNSLTDRLSVGYSPHLDLAIAEKIIAIFGGEIVSVEKPEETYPEGAVF